MAGRRRPGRLAARLQADRWLFKFISSQEHRLQANLLGFGKPSRVAALAAGGRAASGSSQVPREGGGPRDVTEQHSLITTTTTTVCELLVIKATARHFQRALWKGEQFLLHLLLFNERTAEKWSADEAIIGNLDNLLIGRDEYWRPAELSGNIPSIPSSSLELPVLPLSLPSRTQPTRIPSNS